MYRRTLVLTETQEADLRALRDHDRRASLRERAAALLKIAAGQSPTPLRATACSSRAIPIPPMAG